MNKIIVLPIYISVFVVCLGTIKVGGWTESFTVKVRNFQQVAEV